MKKKHLFLISCVLICSILGFLLTGTITNSKKEVIPQNENFKENQEVQASENEADILNNDLNYKEELLLSDNQIKAMANEYQVTEDEVKENIDYYNYQWEKDHPEKVNAAYTETKINKKVYVCNNHEISTNNDDLNNLNGSKGLKTLAVWISKNLDWKKGAATTARGVLKTGYGDCWGLTDFSELILLNNGYSFRVIELKTSESDHHRALEVLTEKGWERFDPSMTTKHYGKKPYNYKVGKMTEVLEVYQ